MMIKKGKGNKPMYQILTLNNISPCGLALLTDRYTYGEDQQAPDGILVRSAAMHNMELAPTVKAIARAGVGVNNIPVEACAEKGVVVFNTPGANANAVKELTIAGLLLGSRKIAEGIQWAASLSGQSDIPKLVEKGKAQFAGPEILGKTLGVIGLGAIGIQVANTAVSLGMDVYGYDPYVSVDAAWRLSRAIHRAQDIKDIFANCDYITIHVPYMPATRHMINAEAFHSMKQGVRLINFSRGELVDNTAALESLKEGKLASYVLDFPAQELIGVPGVIALPHLGASTPESEDNCAKMAVSQMMDFLENGNIHNSVNYPDVSMARSNGERFGVCHKNIHGMLTQITNVFAKEKINIENMTNKSRGEYAYTLIDCSSPSQNIVEALEKIEGVIRVLHF